MTNFFSHFLKEVGKPETETVDTVSSNFGESKDITKWLINKV